MATGTSDVLMEKFVQLLNRSDLHLEEPTQFESNWDNGGKPGVTKVFLVTFEGIPCDVRLSLFFDGEEVVKTGVLVKYRGEPVVNEVRKGDAVHYGTHKRIDPIGFLREAYGQPAPRDPEGSFLDDPPAASDSGESFALAVDQDSEEFMLRAVAQLTAKTEAELRSIWARLLLTNAQRDTKSQVSPFIKIWLRKERGRLDRLYLDEAQLLRSPAQENNPAIDSPARSFIVKRGKAERTYTINPVRLSGAEIKAKVMALDPDWWNGMFWGLQAGVLVQLPHEPGEVEKTVRMLNPNAYFDVDEIFINNRQLYSVIYEGRVRTMVWRPRASADAPPMVVAPVAASKPEAASGGEGPLGRLMGKLRPKAAETEAAPMPDVSDADQFTLGHAERLYVRALLTSAPDLAERRSHYIGVLYESNPTRFFGNPADMRVELLRSVHAAFAGDADKARRETRSVDSELHRFLGLS